MRSKLLRLLVVVAISLTAPIQGVLAATAGLCAMESHDAGHDHEGGHHGHCAPCVAYCAAVAIPSSVLPVFQTVPAAAPEFLPVPAPAGVLPHALDRPPLAG